MEREGGKVVVPEVEEEVSERVGGQGGKEKGCSYLMKTFLNSTVESSEDFCRCAAFVFFQILQKGNDFLAAMTVE